MTSEKATRGTARSPKDYDTQIQFRLRSEEKEQFLNICEDKALNSSEILRRFVVQFIKDNTETLAE